MATVNDDKILLIEIAQPGSFDTGTGVAAERLAAGRLANGGGKRAVATVTAEQVMRLITGRNIELLQIIKRERPQSLAELSRWSGRPTASLTRTLQRLSALGIVVMRKSKGREKIPTVVCDCLRFELPLTPAISEK